MLRKSDGPQMLTTETDRSSRQRTHQKAVTLTRQDALEPSASNRASNALAGDLSARLIQPQTRCGQRS